ncbi:MAG TPA: protein translocase subunit SecD [Candidatus Nealsonbacteria bacterium]|uniref:Protein translocase subunit SecD n=1 Tax=marine sediment metagenome TaxID=412755 RepID=A0A0F9U7K1_9ZZZZ|nr:protein translocase subunit SecD [Candidatus Nealsonbacteria bacterium]HEB46638.1 protein translocase subunit SecD [Candidatus Nealsonbacteria bacterium]
MPKKKLNLIIISILVLAFLAGNLVFPKYFNSGVDSLNSRLRQSFGEQTKFNLPYFPEISFRLGLDLQGGSHLVYEADLSKVEKERYVEAMEGLRDVIERRVNLFGVQEPIVQTQQAGENYRLIVELAGIKDVGEAIKIIGETPYLEFLEQRANEETQIILDKQKELEGKDPEEYQQIENWYLAFQNPYFKPTQLTGKYLEKAQLSFDQTTSKPQIQLQFTEEGTELFEEITERNIGKPLAIFLDGMSIVDTDGDNEITFNDFYAPIVQGKITGGRAVITGNMNISKAKEIIQRLNSGALPVPIKLISQQTVGPTLGAMSLQKSLKAGIIGALAIILFMILFYRLPGVLASLALGIYLVLILSIFKLIPVTLTLAGIGGFVLSIGMAVDANILIFSRMREELREGKDLVISIEEGVRRAWPSIRDGNITTILVSLILFFFGTSFVQGFALTLIFGVLLSMFSAIIITNHFLKFFAQTKFRGITWLWK